VELLGLDPKQRS